MIHFASKPIYWFRRKAAEMLDPTRNQGGAIGAAMRQSRHMGAWDPVLSAWEPRSINPWLYEALKEAVPMLDGGIASMVNLDGVLEVQGGNDRLVGIIEDWMANVPVNDLECGFQAMYESQGDEMYEQGFGIVEFIYDAKGRDVIGLRTADSKGIGFVRDSDRLRVMYRPPGHSGDLRSDGLSNVQDILRGGVHGHAAVQALRDAGAVELDPRQLVFAIRRPEADNPYGTSILRSLPFVAQIIVRLQNSTARIWERFGDPSFHVAYKTGNRSVTHTEAMGRAQTIAKDLSKAIATKVTGNSVDLATGVGKDDEISIEVLGANGEALEIEMPARHMIEQVVAAFGIPAWMIGVSWSQPAGIAEPQVELVLQGSQTRFVRRRPGLHRPIEAMLRARGLTWKKGDWELVQRLPNLHDEVKRAQAGFLRAQTAMMGGDGGDAGTTPAGGPRGVDNNLRTGRQAGGHKHARKGEGDDAEDDGAGEPWADSDPELPRIEAAARTGMLAEWRGLREAVIVVLGLAAADVVFRFGDSHLTDLLTLGNQRVNPLAAALQRGVRDVVDRGLASAGIEISANFDDPLVAAGIARRRSELANEFRREGLVLVRDGFARQYATRIVAALASGEFDGLNADVVAQLLRDRFGGGEYNWERLAASELARAHGDAKLSMYAEFGLTQYDWLVANDGSVCAICTGHAAAGPYDIASESAPRPVRDSHPLCRCTVAAHV